MDKELFLKYGFTLSDKQLNQLDLYSDLLIQYNEKFNLTAITDKTDIYVKHFLDCLYLCKYLVDNCSLLDIGTGAGFPGVVVKIFYPDMDITLLEPNNKKVLFLNTVKQQLNLEKLTISNQRSEDYAKDHRQHFDYVTARAVASLNILLELAIPLLKVNGTFFAMKGPKANQELPESQNALNKLCATVKETIQYNIVDNSRNLIIINKDQPTAEKYPRNYSQIKKKPL
ncbi:MAG: 16S rRNA (guanine(527)-N(7))-methyltransferase RsmG [Erysipelotrichaceae bacterium]